MTIVRRLTRSRFRAAICTERRTILKGREYRRLIRIDKVQSHAPPKAPKAPPRRKGSRRPRVSDGSSVGETRGETHVFRRTKPAFAAAATGDYDSSPDNLPNSMRLGNPADPRGPPPRVPVADQSFNTASAIWARNERLSTHSTSWFPRFSRKPTNVQPHASRCAFQRKWAA